MFLNFYLLLKQRGVPVSFREYLALLSGLQEGLAGNSLDGYYQLARTTLVKHERHLDAFDEVFANYVAGLNTLSIEALLASLQELSMEQLTQLLRQGVEKVELAPIAWEEIQAELTEQRQDSQGSGKGQQGKGEAEQADAGSREGKGSGGKQGSGKPWDARYFRNLDEKQELGTRHLKLALRSLRELSREGAETELDLPATIKRTTRNAGILELKLRAPQRNKVKVLLLLDSGGSMDVYARLCQELFAAAKYEFQRLETYHFHNFIFEHLWQQERGLPRRVPVLELIQRHQPSTKVVIVGDASMAPHEIFNSYRGGADPELLSSFTWLKALRRHFPALVWLSPEPERYWASTETLVAIRKFLGGRMYPLTLNGLKTAVKELKSPGKLSQRT